MPRSYRQSGPIARTLEVVGERWTLLILQELLRGCHRFALLKESVEGIAPNVLSERLKLLEKHGIVGRRFYTDHPPRAEYHLTKKGHELGMLAGALATWGEKYLADETSLVHVECSTKIRVVYFCTTCEVQVPGAGVRLVEQEGSSQGDLPSP